MEGKVGYMCAIDYEYHIEDDWNGTEIFPSVKSLKKQSPCVKSCGILKVKVTVEKTVKKGKV